MAKKTNYIISFDGTASSGKGSISLKLAHYLNFHYLDTGKIYRLAAFKANSLNLDIDSLHNNSQAIASLLFSTIEFYDSNVSLSSIDSLNTEKIASIASKIAQIPAIRAGLTDLQRDFTKKYDKVIMDGRDIGTVICPQANLKFFIDANPAVRARRRLTQQNMASYEEVLSYILNRDTADYTRASAPLKIPTDAIFIDSSLDSVEQTFERILYIISSKIPDLVK